MPFNEYIPPPPAPEKPGRLSRMVSSITSLIPMGGDKVSPKSLSDLVTEGSGKPIAPSAAPASTPHEIHTTEAAKAPSPTEKKEEGGGFFDWFSKPLVDQVEPIKRHLDTFAQAGTYKNASPQEQILKEAIPPKVRGFMVGALEGASTPETIANAAVSPLPGGLEIAPALKMAANAGIGVHAAHVAMDPNRSTSERTVGGLNAVLSMLGLGHASAEALSTPSAAPTPTPTAQPKAPVAPIVDTRPKAVQQAVEGNLTAAPFDPRPRLSAGRVTKPAPEALKAGQQPSLAPTVIDPRYQVVVPKMGVVERAPTTAPISDVVDAKAPAIHEQELAQIAKSDLKGSQLAEVDRSIDQAAKIAKAQRTLNDKGDKGFLKRQQTAQKAQEKLGAQMAGEVETQNDFTRNLAKSQEEATKVNEKLIADENTRKQIAADNEAALAQGAQWGPPNIRQSASIKTNGISESTSRTLRTPPPEEGEGGGEAGDGGAPSPRTGRPLANPSKVAFKSKSSAMEVAANRPGWNVEQRSDGLYWVTPPEAREGNMPLAQTPAAKKAIGDVYDWAGARGVQKQFGGKIVGSPRDGFMVVSHDDPTPAYVPPSAVPVKAQPKAKAPNNITVSEDITPQRAKELGLDEAPRLGDGKASPQAKQALQNILEKPIEESPADPNAALKARLRAANGGGQPERLAAERPEAPMPPRMVRLPGPDEPLNLAPPTPEEPPVAPPVVKPAPDEPAPTIASPHEMLAQALEEKGVPVPEQVAAKRMGPARGAAPVAPTKLESIPDPLPGEDLSAYQRRSGLGWTEAQNRMQGKGYPQSRIVQEPTAPPEKTVGKAKQTRDRLLSEMQERQAKKGAIPAQGKATKTSKPAPEPVAPLTPEEEHGVNWVRAEYDNFPHQKDRSSSILRGDGGIDTQINLREAGNGSHSDIEQIAGRKATRPEVKAAIEKGLAGTLKNEKEKDLFNAVRKLGRAWTEAAAQGKPIEGLKVESSVEGFPHTIEHSPILPPEAGGEIPGRGVEEQPSLPEAGAVRSVENPTPTFKAPVQSSADDFSLERPATPEVKAADIEAEKAKSPSMFDEEVPAGKNPLEELIEKAQKSDAAKDAAQQRAKETVAGLTPEQYAESKARVDAARAKRGMPPVPERGAVPMQAEAPKATQSLEELVAAEEAAGNRYGELKQLKAAGKATEEEVRAAGRAAQQARIAASKALAQAKTEKLPQNPPAEPPSAVRPNDSPDPVPQIADKESMNPQEKESWIKQQLAELDALNKRKGESGGVPLPLLGRMASSAVGSLAGSAADEDHPLRGALMGGVAGYYAPGIMRTVINEARDIPMDSHIVQNVAAKAAETFKTGIKLLPDYQRYSLLMNTYNLPLNVWVGPWGSSVMASLESALKGEAKGRAGLKLFLLRADKFAKEWINAKEETGRVIDQVIERSEGPMSGASGQLRKFLEVPGNAMTRGDIAARNLLREAGFSDLEARTITLTSEPWSGPGRAVAAFKRGGVNEFGLRNAALDMTLPFYRTNANQVESGMERLPGVGMFTRRVPGISLTQDKLFERSIRQALGTATGMAGYKLGKETDPANAPITMKVLQNATGQYALPVLIGFVYGQAEAAGKDPLESVSTTVGSILQNMPLPTTKPMWDMYQSGKKYVTGDFENKTDLIPTSLKPNMLRDEQIDKQNDLLDSLTNPKPRPIIP